MTVVRCVWVLWALTYLADPTRAQEMLKDVHGDPLPVGAIGRLGKLAFRVASPVDAVRYLDGGSKFLVKTRNAVYHADGCFQLFDARSGKELSRFTSEM